MESGDGVLQSTDLDGCELYVINKNGETTLITYNFEETTAEIADDVYLGYDTQSDGRVNFFTSSNPDGSEPVNYTGAVSVVKIVWDGVTYTPAP